MLVRSRQGIREKIGGGPSVVSRMIFDNARLQGPPHPQAPLPQGGEGSGDSLALAPLGERVAGHRRFHQPVPDG